MGFTRHPAPDDWAAYVGDELPPRIRARLRSHLEGCARCQADLVRIEGIQRVLKLPVPEPDELSWRRLEVRLEREFEAPGEVQQFSVDLPPGATRDIRRRSMPSTMDLVRGRRWLLAGAAAVIAVAGFIALAPRGTDLESPRTAEAPTSAAPGTALVHSGSAPLRVELGTGHVLGLASDTEVTMPEPDREPTEIELDHGRLDVWSPRALAAEAALGEEAGGPIIIRTPERTLWAESRDFTVAYLAGRHEVSVREGWVELGGEPTERVEAGQSEVLEARPPRPAEPRSAVLERLRSPTRKRGRTKTSPPPTPADVPEAPVAAREISPNPVPEVRVEQIDGPTPTAAAWSRARRAWYRERDPTAAVAAVRALLALGPDPELERTARHLLCDAQVGLRAGAEALRDCKAVLDLERDPRRIRRVHYTLATIYRDHLHDCRSALPHYDRALVFGGVSRFDDVVRISRAECSLDLGQLDVARSDLDALAGRKQGARVTRARRRLDDLAKEARNDTDEDD